MSFVVCVTFRIHQQHTDAFHDLVKHNAHVSLESEKGCTQFDVCANGDEPGEVFLYEIYDTPDAFDLHLKTDHFLSFQSDVDHMIESKQVKTFQLVS